MIKAKRLCIVTIECGMFRFTWDVIDCCMRTEQNWTLKWTESKICSNAIVKCAIVHAFVYIPWHCHSKCNKVIQANDMQNNLVPWWLEYSGHVEVYQLICMILVSIYRCNSLHSVVSFGFFAKFCVNRCWPLIWCCLSQVRNEQNAKATESDPLHFHWPF